MVRRVLLCVVLLSRALPSFGQDQASGPLAAAIQPYVESHELAGAVMLVADKDQVLAVETVGFADIANDRSMSADAMFWIASQTKSMTAAAVMMMVDEGRIALDEAVEDYLPEFKGQMVISERDDEHVLLVPPTHPITIRNVLSHTSGLPFRSPVEDPTLDALSLKVAVKSYSMMPLDFQPETKYQYSNAGINTAARILEVVTGETYEGFMQERLFNPLGMTDTTFWPNEEQIARLAKTYRPDASKKNLEEAPLAQLLLPLDDHQQRYPMPAGGLFSTAGDVAKFCQMILRGGEFNGKRLLSNHAVRELTRRQTPEALPQNYGLGFSTGETFGHGGAHATNMTIDPHRGLITVWMVQHAGFPGSGKDAQGIFRNAANKLR